MRIRKYDYQKTRARKLVQKAIWFGKLEHPQNCLCWICGNGRWETPDIEMLYHHPDYKKPLEVFPLCKSCHIILHIAIGDYPYKRSLKFKLKDWQII